MKTTRASALRAAAFAVALLVAPALAFANDTAPADRAAQQLALKGSVPVKAAGPYVAIGTYQVQVAAKLGRPATALPDGTWLYPNFTVNDTDTTGTLVMRFNNQGRVSELSLVTPAVAMAMSAPKKASDKILVAANK
jgi:hypothetical protein